MTLNAFFCMFMRLRPAILLLCVSLALVAGLVPQRTHSQATVPDYKNANLPVERRVSDLLGRMTLEEKVAQLTCLWQARPQVKPQTDFTTSRGELSAEKAREVLKNGIGQVARQRERMGPREGALFANSVQKWLLENTDWEYLRFSRRDTARSHGPGQYQLPSR